LRCTVWLYTPTLRSASVRKSWMSLGPRDLSRRKPSEIASSVRGIAVSREADCSADACSAVLHQRGAATFSTSTAQVSANALSFGHKSPPHDEYEGVYHANPNPTVSAGPSARHCFLDLTARCTCRETRPSSSPRSSCSVTARCGGTMRRCSIRIGGRTWARRGRGSCPGTMVRGWYVPCPLGGSPYR
jgi:hypothetical protein